MSAPMIGLKALAVYDAQVLAERLREERNQINCSRPYDERGLRVPCWKHWQDGAEDRQREPFEKWCDNCREREAKNAEYRVATNRRGALRRSLRASCRTLRQSEVAE